MPCPTQHILYYLSCTFSEHQAHMTEPHCTTRHHHPDVPHAHKHHLPHQALLLVYLGAGMVEQQAHVTRHLLIARTGMLQCDTSTLIYYLLLRIPTTTHIMPTLSIYASIIYSIYLKSFVTNLPHSMRACRS